jgi:GntR family transcriptional regulator
VLAGPRPGYVVLHEELSRLIGSGEWPADQQIPSERDLCARYGVSRTTVRQALQLAGHHGLLVRVPGRGTFVAQPHVTVQLARMARFQDTLGRQGIAPGGRLLHAGWEQADAAVAGPLELPEGARALRVLWLALGREKPLALYDSFLRSPAADLVESRLEREGADALPTYELAGAGLGADSLLAGQTFEAVIVDAAGAGILGVPPGSAAFRMTSTFRARDGSPVEHHVALCPGGRCSLHIVRELHLPAG